MNTPRNPNDPDSLLLARSGSNKPDDNKPDFSKVKSGVSSTEAETRPTAGSGQADFSKVQSSVASTEQAVGEQTYTVQTGDTLSHIAKTFYGKASAYPRIFEANRDQLDDPDRIRPGQVLKIPAADD